MWSSRPQITRVSTITWSNILHFYDHLTLHIVPGPRSLEYFVPFIITIVALLTPPEKLSHRQLQWVVLPLNYAIQTHVWIRDRSFDVISANMVLTTFMLLGWYDVRKDFKYVRRMPVATAPRATNEVRVQPGTHAVEGEVKEISGQRESLTTTVRQDNFILESYPPSFVPRLKWVGTLLLSLRFTDWHIGLSSHDSKQPAPIKSFQGFVLETMLHSIFAYTLLDFTSPYMIAVSCASHPDLPAPNHLIDQAVRSLVLLAHFYAALAVFTALLPHLISISTMILAPSIRSNSMLSPLTWPSHLGAFSSIYRGSETSRSLSKFGLRAFWGVFWHQNMRYMTSTPGLAVATLLNLQRGSKFRYMLVVASGFFWSGVVHMGVVPPEPIDTVQTSWEMRLRLAAFFWVQPLGIGVEDYVQFCISKYIRSGKEPTEDTTLVKRVLGFLKACIVVGWTISFLASTAYLTVLPVGCEMGWWNVRLPSLAYLRYLTR